MKTNQKTKSIITVEMFLPMLNFFPHSMYLKDIEGKFIWVNTVKANHYGLEPKDMIGKTDFDFLPREEALKCFEDDQQVMATGIPIIGRIEELTRPDGQKVFQSATKIAIKDDEGKIIGTFGASRDVTKSVMREKEVLAIVGLASHDIRSSLNSMIINLRLMSEDRFGPIGPSVKKVLEEILATGNRLMSKTNEILRQATIEGMKIDEQQIFDLREEVLDPVLLELKDNLDEMEIFVDNSLGSIPTETIEVRLGNAVLVKQVLLDLCKNALKYVKKGGTIAFGFEDIGEFFKLNVYNDGPPVPADMREAIFDEFTSGTGSTGVGLPLARKIIRMLGGELWYEESLDGHPNFVFTLRK
jgi:PAS domain S-box-containing protein